MKLKNQRGSALLETVVCSVALLIFFSTLLVSIYVLLAVYWTDFWSYRAMICLLPESTPHRCEAQLISRLNLVIPRSHFRVEELWKTSNKTSVTVTIDLIVVNNPPKKTFQLVVHRIRKEISLPLTNRVSLSP